MRCPLVVQPTGQGHPSRDQHGHELTGEAEGKIKEIADYCETDVVGTYQVWLRYELFRGTLSQDAFAASERNLANFMIARSKLVDT